MFQIIAALKNSLVKSVYQNNQKDIVSILENIRIYTRGNVIRINHATDIGMMELAGKIMIKYHDSPNIIRWCFMIFRTLTYNRADNQTKMSQLGFNESIIMYMKKYSESEELIEAGCMALQNSSWLIDANRTQIYNLGGIELLIDIVKTTNNKEILLLGFWLYTKFSSQ